MGRVFTSVAACFVLAVSSLANATTVVTNGNISLSAGGGISDYMLSVFQDAAGTDPTPELDGEQFSALFTRQR